MTIHKALHPRDDMDCVKKINVKGRGLASIEDCTDASAQELKDYVNKAKQR